MNLQLVKLYAENDRFREINFKPGINLITGQKSTDNVGKVKSKKQNGVGKTLSVELINFCLFKTQGSKVLRINDTFLAKNEFIYLHFRIDKKNVVIGRNKSGEVRIKVDSNSEFQSYSVTDGKRFIENLLQFNTKPVTLREYLNFFIKDAGYTYEEFAQLYRSSYADLLKIHFYLFDLPVDVLVHIKGAYASHVFAKKRISKVKKELKTQGVELDKLQAKKNLLESKVKDLEDDFDYSKILESLQSRSDDVNALEKELEGLILSKKSLDYEINELMNFANEFSDDLYIDDKDLTLVFDKYKKGLGSLVSRDLEAVKKFRDQLGGYKTELVESKLNNSRLKLEEINKQIGFKTSIINKFYADINQTKKNHIVKSFRVYRDEVNEFKNYETLLNEIEDGDREANAATTEFALALAKLSKAMDANKEIKQSFQRTFLGIHAYVTSSVEASFDFTINSKFSSSNTTNFFRFIVNSETAGSTGSNQMTAAIYDAALHKDPLTCAKTYGLVVHDNLIFGLIEKDSSIQYLNYIHENFNEGEFQYIATVNMDEFNYTELKDDFKYDVSKDVIIELTRVNPLFYKMSSSLVLAKTNIIDESIEE